MTSIDCNKRIEVVSFLGDCFEEVIKKESSHNFPGFDNIYYNNPWFSEEFVKYSLKSWAQSLNRKNIAQWLSAYPNLPALSVNKKLAIITAGNIPLVGLHDVLCGIICGYDIIIKPSSKDKILIEWIKTLITDNFPEYKNRLIIEYEKLKDFDAVIATGSDNSNRYFEYYFSKYPSILRKNKNSIAILSGNESKKELDLLADDIFMYFGLGCRSVSKIFIPENYDFEKLFESFKKYSNLIYHNKYVNNYDYRKALFQMNRIEYLDFENILLSENTEFSSPIAVLNYEKYKNINTIINTVKEKHFKLQCVISNNDMIDFRIDFGKSQNPDINEYADKIDTINFLNSKTK